MTGATGYQGKRGTPMRSSPRIRGMNHGRFVAHIEDAHAARAGTEQYIVEMIAN
jgi:hypothetical protein